MLKENSPEKYRPEAPERKKGKIPSKKQWMEIVRAMLEINPDMDPQEVIERIKAADQRKNPNTNPQQRNEAGIIHQLREEKLIRQGFNPEKWTFYTTGLQPEAGWDTEFTDQDMKKAAKNLPVEIELLVSQGRISSTSDVDRRNGREHFIEIPHFWETYVRIRPENSLESRVPQLDASNELTL